MKHLKNLAIGLFIGIGAVSPGISASAIAIITGLYVKMIEAVNHLFRDFKNHGLFLLTLGIGITVGVVTASAVLLKLITAYEEGVMFTFAGLILGSFPALLKTASLKGYSYRCLISFSLALGLSLVFAYLSQNESGEWVSSTNAVLTIKNCFYFILIGFIAAGSLIIPGISGTVLLVLLGVYGTVLGAVAGLKELILPPFGHLPDESAILLPLAIGAFIGVWFFSKLIGYLVNRHYSITYFALCGFVIGCIPKLIPVLAFPGLYYFGAALILSYLLNFFMAKK